MAPFADVAGHSRALQQDQQYLDLHKERTSRRRAIGSCTRPARQRPGGCTVCVSVCLVGAPSARLSVWRVHRLCIYLSTTRLAGSGCVGAVHPCVGVEVEGFKPQSLSHLQQEASSHPIVAEGHLFPAVHQVLAAGGSVATFSEGQLDSSCVDASETFNATTGMWRTAGTLNTPRCSGAAVTLSDGKVLVCLSACDVFGRQDARLSACDALRRQSFRLSACLPA
jgi:hypothetical protein